MVTTKIMVQGDITMSEWRIYTGSDEMENAIKGYILRVLLLGNMMNM